MPHFKAIAVKFGMRVRSWGSLPRQNIVKIAQGGIPILGKFIPKNQFWRFWGCTPTFFTHSDEIWHEGANLGLSPQAKFCIKNA